MATTFNKRQKEMKRLEKQRMKEERRAMKKLANRALRESGGENPSETLPAEAEPQGSPEQPEESL
jgi:hypothetical protein